MASGSYFPVAVREKGIPKADGKIRYLGIPTVCDRVAQMVIREELELILEPHFSKNSFAYRPGKSAHNAIEQCKLNCQKYKWVIDLDIKGFFDNIDWELLLIALNSETCETDSSSNFHHSCIIFFSSLVVFFFKYA